MGFGRFSTRSKKFWLQMNFKRKKYKSNRSIGKYKVKLVAKAFTQKQNVDYFDTFSPITSIFFL